MKNIYEHLTWLPPAPEDFQERLKGAKTGSALIELAKHALDENKLNRLSKTLRVLEGQASSLSPLTKLDLGFISNTTTNLIAPVLVGTALRFGMALNVVENEYNQVAQAAFSPNSVLSQHQLNAILVSIDYRGIPFLSCPGDKNTAEANLKNCFNYLESVTAALRKKSGAQIILQNLAPPPECLFGSYEGRLPGTLSWLITRLNIELERLASDDVCILDVAGLASNVGLSKWHDPAWWNVAKLPFSQIYSPIYADYICRILAAKAGRSRRCLVLDLDNTLWGGVIGDDGLEGILIGNGHPTAEAHLNVQRTTLDLRDRGVVLAVSSKNDDATARQPFQEHPDMLLKENHIAAFQANWSDKASNIKAISETLALGLQSMVFLDDNPAERMRVRMALPDVAVPELPDDPALYARTLIAAGYFEAVSFSEEDRRRASFFQDNAKRAYILNNSSDMSEYLRSLSMEISLTPFDLIMRSRIVQLISKSNQFNLTTKRYSHSDIENIEADSSLYTRQIRLKDALGDIGMVSVIICKKMDDVWEIDSWLMSCRVLGRRVEEAALQDIIKNAKDSGARKLIGKFVPTTRNSIVRDHYGKLGFAKKQNSADAEIWELDIEGYQHSAEPLPFKYAF